MSSITSYFNTFSSDYAEQIAAFQICSYMTVQALRIF